MNIYINILGKIFLLLAIIFSFLTWIQIPENTGENIYLQGDSHIVFLLDVSKSMKVGDIEGASRIHEAKEIIYKTISSHSGYSFALNIFAGESLRVLPFTSEISLFSTFLKSIDSNNITIQGTKVDEALRDAILNFNDDITGTIIMLTDGDEENITIRNDTKKLLEDKDIQLLIIGVGTLEGGYIPTGDIFAPYKIYNGVAVVARLNSSGLKKLARDLGGTYYSYQEEIELSAIRDKKDTGKIPRTIIISFLFYILYLLSLGYTLYFKRNI